MNHKTKSLPKRPPRGVIFLRRAVAAQEMFEALEFYATGKNDNGALARKVIALAERGVR